MPARGHIPTQLIPYAKISRCRSQDPEPRTILVFSNLAPKPAITTARSPSFGSTDPPRIQSDVDEDPQSSSQLSQPTHSVAETMSMLNEAGSHVENNLLGFSGTVGGSNSHALMNDIQYHDNYILATPFNPLSGIQSQSQMETSWSGHFQNSLGSQPPLMIPQILPLAYRPSKICAACDERLMTLRNHIKAIPDIGIAMQLLDIYFGLRDNWHGCH